MKENVGIEISIVPVFEQVHCTNQERRSNRQTVGIPAVGGNDGMRRVAKQANNTTRVGEKNEMAIIVPRIVVHHLGEQNKLLLCQWSDHILRRKKDNIIFTAFTHCKAKNTRIATKADYWSL